MRILAIESSCDETSAAVVERDECGRMFIRSNIVASQVDVHRKFGGVVPEIASRAHVEAISGITYEALETAGVTLRDLDGIAVTTHPGLIGALLVAVNFAKSLAVANHLPLYPVDHIKGHIAAAYLTGHDPAPAPPFLALAVSGGHTALYAVRGYTDFALLGATRDDAAGEAFDKIGRILGIPYPAGRDFDTLAAEGFAAEGGYHAFSRSAFYRDPAFRLPSPGLPGDTLDFSFSGLKTAAINLLHRLEQTGQPLPRAAFAARYTYEAVEAIAAKTEAAMTRFPASSLVAAGGVAANSHLRQRLTEICEKRGLPLFLPPLSLCGDNGAMIAAQGIHEALAGHTAGADLNASACDSPEMCTVENGVEN